MATEIIHKGKVGCGNCKGHGQKIVYDSNGLPQKRKSDEHGYIWLEIIYEPCPHCEGKGHFGTVDEYLEYQRLKQIEFDNCKDFGIL